MILSIFYLSYQKYDIKKVMIMIIQYICILFLRLVIFVIYLGSFNLIKIAWIPN